MTMEKILIVCVNEEYETIFKKEVPRTALMQSEMVRNLFDVSGSDSANDIPIPEGNLYNERHLDLLVEYCEFLSTDEFPKELRIKKLHEDSDELSYYIETCTLTDWEKDYIDRIGDDILESMIMVANYFNVPTLLELLCHQAGTILEGKTPEEIRIFFGAADDLSDERKEVISKENNLTSTINN